MLNKHHKPLGSLQANLLVKKAQYRDQGLQCMINHQQHLKRNRGMTSGSSTKGRSYLFFSFTAIYLISQARSQEQQFQALLQQWVCRKYSPFAFVVVPPFLVLYWGRRQALYLKSTMSFKINSKLLLLYEKESKTLSLFTFLLVCFNLTCFRNDSKGI